MIVNQTQNFTGLIRTRVIFFERLLRNSKAPRSGTWFRHALLWPVFVVVIGLIVFFISMCTGSPNQVNTHDTLFDFIEPNSVMTIINDIKVYTKNKNDSKAVFWRDSTNGTSGTAMWSGGEGDGSCVWMLIEFTSLDPDGSFSFVATDSLGSEDFYGQIMDGNDNCISGEKPLKLPLGKKVGTRVVPVEDFRNKINTSLATYGKFILKIIQYGLGGSNVNKGVVKFENLKPLPKPTELIEL